MKMIKSAIYEFESILGVCLGFLMRFLPKSLRLNMYTLIVGFLRKLSTKTAIRLHPFLYNFGETLFDDRGDHVAELHLVNGSSMALNLSEKTQRLIFSQKLYESGLSQYILKNLKSGDVFLDIGANVGYFSILSAKIVGSSGKIVSIEPEKKNYQMLRKNIERNNFANVESFNIGAGDKEGELKLYINPLNHGGNSMIEFSQYKSGAKHYKPEEIKKRFGDELCEMVKIRPVDYLLNELKIQKVALAKVDVEGFEGPVIKGLEKSIRGGRIESLLCELNNNKTRDEIYNFFLTSGYRAYRLSLEGELLEVSGGSDGKIMKGDILFRRAIK